MGLRVSTSITKVAYECPRLFEKSSTPSTVTCPISGSGSARTSWISVSRQTSYSQQRQQPGSGSPGQGQRHQLQQPAQQYRAAGIPLGESRDRLRERPHSARWILAGQTADRERDQDRTARCGQIMQKPAVVAVDPGGGRAASPARCRSAPGMRRHQHVVPLIGHFVDGQVRQVGEEHRQAAGIARHDMPDTGHNEPHGRSDEDQVLGRTRSSRSGRTSARAVTRLRPSRMKSWIPSATAPHRNRQNHLTMKAASRPDDHAACTGLWISVQRTSDIDSRCRCLKSCAPMTEVGCTGHQPRLAGTPRWRVSAASDPVKHVLACASVSEKFARNQESTQGLVLLAHSFACSFQRFTTAGGSSARSGRCACGTVPGKAGFHGFGPVVRRVSAVARRPAAPGRSGCPGRGPHRRAAGRPGRGRAAVSRPSGRRR